MKARSHAPTRKTKDAADRRQNNKNVRQCPLAIAQQLVYYAASCCLNCCAEQSHKDNVRCTAVEKQPRQKKSNFQAQFRLLALVSSGLS